MEPRAYVLVVEIMSANTAAPPFDVRILDAYDVHEACRQALMETIGRYGCDNCQIVYVRPATLANLRAGCEVSRELPLMRMAPVGRVA
jgi:hypothetical protein